MAGVLLTALGLALASLALTPWPLTLDELWIGAAAAVIGAAASVRLGFSVRMRGLLASVRLAAYGLRRNALSVADHARVLSRGLAADIILRPALARVRAPMAGGAYGRALAETPGVMPVDVGDGVALVHLLNESDAGEQAIAALDRSMAPLLRRAP